MKLSAMSLSELGEKYDRATVEPVIDYINRATGIEWLSVGEDLGRGPRYISNIKARTWKGQLAGVYALVYMAEIARARGIDRHKTIRCANTARAALELALADHYASTVKDRYHEVREAGMTETHPSESR